MTRRAPAAWLALTALLAAWALFPVALILLHDGTRHATWTGADGLIGAHGVLGVDQLQYLSWARDASAHGLASDLFTLGGSGHVYLEPAAELMAGLRRIGVSLPAGVVILTVIAAALLAAALLAWVRRLLGGRPAAQAAAVALAVAASSPASAVIDWAQLGSGPFRFAAYLAGDEQLLAAKLWGYLPAAFALSLMTFAVLWLERGIEQRRRAPIAGAAGAALLASWLHPWQGATLALLILGLALWRRDPREWPALAAVLLGAAVPLAYYIVLSHADPAWHIASQLEDGSRLPAAVLALCVAPLVAIAALGVRRVSGFEPAEQALVLWIPAALVVYFVNDAYATHALEAIGLPFGVLAVRAADRLSLRPALATLAALALTVPVAAYEARKFARTATSPLVQYAVGRDDMAALRWVARRAPRGGVLAAMPFAATVPAITGRAVWVGDGYWTPHYAARARAARQLFTGRLSPTAARALVHRTGARVLVSDCAHHADLTRALGSMVTATRQFGCARVDVLRRG
jgi:hypothetical protein